MPNWCSNYLYVDGETSLIDKIEKAVESNELLEGFCPMPKELKDEAAPVAIGRPTDREEELYQKYGFRNWYEFSTSKWGTKWDISGGEVVERGPNHIVCRFETAWAPPLPVMEAMEQLGLNVTLDYYEPGMNFVGKYSEGFDDHYEASPGECPEEMDEFWGITETYENYREMEELESAENKDS